ncbi:hypothetical protein AKJ09_07833 [Labilithrix luteola]|uniref:Uncharacterized protein n=1 Tax=Labilithrix luteola TaxID=1391654 RepID=A0A0K1Q6Z0_9BACT|nr:hypothetical protein AKJ09_07833 [Labilithrix luteola]
MDFDALHAALGVGEHAQGAVRPREPSVGASEVLDEIAAEIAPRVGESSGRTNAHYASSRPHTIPPTRAPVEDPNVPAVIVDEPPVADDLQTTTPIAAPMARRAASSGSIPTSGRTGTALLPKALIPEPAPPPSQPLTPPPFSAQAAQTGPSVMKHTVPMVNRPRRPRAQTIVVRRRGPSAKQKLLAFVSMLVLVTCCGIAVIVWRKPSWIGLSAGVTPTPTMTQTAMAPVVAQASTIATTGTTSTASALPPVTAPSVASAASSAKKTPKPPTTAHPASH